MKNELGRPNVKELIKNAKKKYASNNSDLGIITCGPPGIQDFSSFLLLPLIMNLTNFFIYFLAMVADVENLAIDEGYAFHAETFEL